ncbi:PucR C-terminal helix-turn-helix domain-containing protein [Nonomuraea maritima]|uniref:PucR C-terminal helix-turn-helix domain-containing protein n=1 Tax=Nonomuraea maritima TaxID=683260 RepID=A0A1G9GXF8_9ACTN|nr:helix-turn-helix domain-containing protein [Nonomuraea maritima]SDL05400.1 PucR C-terminal helix-turn-helix domain-containing protein [Nonomuraea maritima]
MYLGQELRKLAGPATPEPATGVRLVEDLNRVAGQPPGAVLVLTEAASRQAAGYRLDIALRDAAAAGAVALVLTSEGAELDRSAAALAERGRVAVFALAPPTGQDEAAPDQVARDQARRVRAGRDSGAPDLAGPGRAVPDSGGSGVAQGDLAGLVVALAGAIAGDAADALVRTARAAEDVVRSGGVPERIAQAASAALGVRVTAEGTSFTAEPHPGHLGRASAIVLRLASLAAAAGPADELPGRSRAQLLTELLVAPETQAQELAPRARALGLPVDDWHVVLRLEPVMDPGQERHALLETAASRALRATRELVGPVWNATLADDALVVVRTAQRDPGRTGLRAAVRDATRLLERVRPAGAELRCGVSTAHEGLLGLRTCASEARTALRRSELPLATYDLAGLDRMLEEWYASDAAQQAVRELLQPVLDLGGERAGRLLTILRAYLDHHGSPARAAEELHLHRNAVSRNVRRIEQLLQADLDDPRQRLALQLACRAARGHA